MAENKKSIIVYADWIELFDVLEDIEAGKLIKHFFRYVNDLNPIAPDRITELSFIPIKQSLKRDLSKWNETLENRSKAGKASAEARRLLKENEQSSTNPTIVENVEQNSTHSTDSVSVSVSVNDSVIKKESIDSRKLKFSSTLKPFLNTYGKDLLNDFYAYWTEPNKSNTKFKQEIEQTWDLKRRLDTWAKNDKNFGSNKKQESKKSLGI